VTVVRTLCAFYALALTGTCVGGLTGALPVDRIAGPAMVVLGAVALAGAVRAAWHPALDARTRLAWRVVAAAFTLALATPIVFLVTGPEPFPAPGDGTHLAFVFLLSVASLLFPVHAASRRERWKVLLDAATVLTGASMLIWFVAIGPVQASGAGAAVLITAAAYPVADLIMLFGFARVLLRGLDRSSRRPIRLLALGMLIYTAGDAYLGYMEAYGSQVERTPWQFVCWLTTHFLTAVAAVDQCRRAQPQADGTRYRQALTSKLPYAAVGVGYALMVIALLRETRLYPWGGLVLGGLLLTAFVVVRQAFVQQETDDLAATDPLTGLANRGRLHEVLARSLERAARSGRVTGVLVVDMNGFKQVNDTLGHLAGDRLLVAFAEATRGAVAGRGLVGRQGGDEFAVVLSAISGVHDAVTVARQLVAALEPPVLIDGVAVQPAASIGVATCGPGELTPDELLHRADVAMYTVKKRGPATGWAVWGQPGQPAAAAQSAATSSAQPQESVIPAPPWP
jgi:diguanylate cyclase (GGDEF)-like protein